MMTWPTAAMYESAIRDWRQTLHDPDLAAGQLQAYPNGDPIPIHSTGHFVCAYKVGDWLVRCFRFNEEEQQNPPDDIRTRYEEIARFYAQHAAQLGMLVPTIYLPEGITVGGQLYPVVKMRFLTQAPTLGIFVRDHVTEAQTMRRLAESWMALCTAMEEAPLAHGDLDLTNVLVQPTATGFLPLRLIDYDNMWLPALAGLPQVEGGHAPFQHPDIRPRPYDATMDRFSQLVIYISLLALTLNPTLYGECRADESEKLLFDKADYRNVGFDDNRIRVVRRRVGNAQLNPYLDALEAALRDKVMPPRLDAIPRTPVAATSSPLNVPLRPPMPARPVAPMRPKDMPAPSAPIYPQPTAGANASRPRPANVGYGAPVGPQPAPYYTSAPTPTRNTNAGLWVLLAVLFVIILIVFFIVASGTHAFGMVAWSPLMQSLVVPHTALAG